MTQEADSIFRQNQNYNFDFHAEFDFNASITRKGDWKGAVIVTRVKSTLFCKQNQSSVTCTVVH